MTATIRAPLGPLNLLFGFIAGFLATLIFHQLTVALLWKLGMTNAVPFALQPRPPFGVPAVLSLAFWGGVWGILFAGFDHRFSRPVVAIGLPPSCLGAILPSLVALLVVVPLKGSPVGAGFAPAIWLFAFTVNGAWGLGTGLFLAGLRNVSSR